MKGVTVFLDTIDYRGADIGNDLSFEIRGTTNTTIRSFLKYGSGLRPNRLLHTGSGPVYLRVAVTEHDLSVNDFGSEGIHIAEYGSHHLTVNVNEATQLLGRSGWAPVLRRSVRPTQAAFEFGFFAAYASTGARSGLPSFSELKRHYPAYDARTSADVKSDIGGKVNYAWIVNTCAIRMSRTLNYNSLELPKDDAGMKVVSGADNKWYAYRVTELRKWLTKKIGNPQFDHVKTAHTPFDKRILKNVKGIIAFEIQFGDATGHFDLWDGQDFTSERSGGAVDYWGKASRISLWEAG